MDFDGYDRVIDTHIKNLRKKIEDDPKNPVYVRTPLANVSAQLETVLEGVWEATTERLQVCYDVTDAFRSGAAAAGGK